MKANVSPIARAWIKGPNLPLCHSSGVLDKQKTIKDFFAYLDPKNDYLDIIPELWEIDGVIYCGNIKLSPTWLSPRQAQRKQIPSHGILVAQWTEKRFFKTYKKEKVINTIQDLFEVINK